MTKQNTKHTQKKSWINYSIKNILLAVCVAIFCHIFYVNIMISLSSNTVNQLLVITPVEDITSARLSLNNQLYLDKNIELFHKYEMQKILILSPNNSQNISGGEVMKNYLLENDIWWGHIIQIDSYTWDYYKEILGLLSNQKIPAASIFAPFGKYYQYWELFHAQNYNKISVNVYYSGWKDFCMSLFSNYYYFWKNLY